MIDSTATAKRLERRDIRRGAVLSALVHLSPLLFFLFGSFTLIRVVDPPPNSRHAESQPAESQPTDAQLADSVLQETAAAVVSAPAARAPTTDANGRKPPERSGTPDTDGQPPQPIRVEIVFDLPRPRDRAERPTDGQRDVRPEDRFAGDGDSVAAAAGGATSRAPDTARPPDLRKSPPSAPARRPGTGTAGSDAPPEKTPEAETDSARPPPALPGLTAAAPATVVDILADLRARDRRLAQVTTPPAGAAGPTEAARLKKKADRFARAAALGYAHARYNLAAMLLRGESQPPAQRDARDMLRRAAFAGHGDAALLAAYLAMWGDAGKPDFVTAHAMLSLAARAGKAEAVDARQRLAQRMLPGEVGSARRLYLEWASLSDARPNGANGRGEKGLLAAAASGDLETAQLSLAGGANADARGTDSRTPLITAAWRGFPKMTRALLDRGADPDLADADGRTALHWAAINGRAEVAPILTDAGAKVDARDEAGLTPLMRAAWNGHVSLVRHLLANGADPALRDRRGRSALDLARGEHHGEIAALLAARGG